MSDEKRVILVKPGDVLLIGGVGYGSPRQATEATIEIDQLSTEQLRELLKRAEDQSAVGGPQVNS